MRETGAGALGCGQVAQLFSMGPCVEVLLLQYSAPSWRARECGETASGF